MKNAPLYLNWRNGAKIHGEQMKIKLRLYLICRKSMVNKLEKAAGVPKVNSCFICLLPFKHRGGISRICPLGSPEFMSMSRLAAGIENQ